MHLNWNTIRKTPTYFTKGFWGKAGYLPDADTTEKVMRPSKTLNTIIDAM